MPHLDANVLMSDASDLAFLRDVLGTSESVAPSRGAFDPARLQRNDKVPSRELRRPKGSRLVSEAA